MAKLNFNTTILQHISREINNGRALWGVLWANEYLAPQDPMRKALVKKAKLHLTPASEISPAIKLIEDGATLSELSPEMQIAVREHNEGRSAKRYHIPMPVYRHKERKQALRRARA